jgi:hypothetical protein
MPLGSRPVVRLLRTNDPAKVRGGCPAPLPAPRR